MPVPLTKHACSLLLATLGILAIQVELLLGLVRNGDRSRAFLPAALVYALAALLPQLFASYDQRPRMLPDLLLDSFAYAFESLPGSHWKCCSIRLVCHIVV